MATTLLFFRGKKKLPPHPAKKKKKPTKNKEKVPIPKCSNFEELSSLLKWDHCIAIHFPDL